MKASSIRETIFSILTSRMHGAGHQTNISSNVILSIIKDTKQLFKKENSLLQLHGNFVVVGDIHGNINDLLRIFERCGYPPKSNYIFLGDYVDRGPNSLEVIIFLFCFKILYPNNLFMIRGNHECESITTIYGFKKDCDKKYDQTVYNKFMKCFMNLSYAAVVNDSYLCVHGGIGPYLRYLDDIDQIEKPLISANSQIANDLVWSDPNDSVKGFQESARGTGYYFNAKKLNSFLKENRLKKLIRSHEHCFDGYDYSLQNCITIFSNSDYCEMNNDAAVLLIKYDTDFEDPDSEDKNINESFICEDDADLKFEIFSPMTEKELKKRRILIPESLLSEMTEKMELQKEDCISTHDLFEQISQPICVF